MASGPATLSLPLSPRAAWTVLGIAALGLLAYQDLRHTSGVVRLAPGPVVTVTTPASSPAWPSPSPSPSPSLTPSAPTGPLEGILPIAQQSASAAPSPSPPVTPSLSTSSVRPSTAPSPMPSGPGPSAPVPLTVVAVTISPGRHALLDVRASVTAAAAPPFPAWATAFLVDQGVKATITLR